MILGLSMYYLSTICIHSTLYSIVFANKEKWQGKTGYLQPEGIWKKWWFLCNAAVFKIAL